VNHQRENSQVVLMGRCNRPQAAWDIVKC